MTKLELKKIIKETVKECIREVLLEDKMFSSIMKEVISNTKEMVLESVQEEPRRSPMIPKPKRSLEEFDVDLPRRNTDRFEVNSSRTQEAPSILKSDEKDAYSYSSQLAEGINTVPLDAIMLLLNGGRN